MEKIKPWKKGSIINKTVLKDCKKKHTNLYMAWIDHRKAYHFARHSWINECIELSGIADNVRTFFGKEYGAIELIANV